MKEKGVPREIKPTCKVGGRRRYVNIVKLFSGGRRRYVNIVKLFSGGGGEKIM